MRHTTVKMSELLGVSLAVVLAVGCGDSGGLGPDGDGTDGMLPPGRDGTTSYAMDVDPSTWYRITNVATANTAILVYIAEPLSGENQAGQCIDATCAVDFVTGPDATTYQVVITNYSTQPVSYEVRTETLPIVELIPGGASEAGELMGKHAAYYAFEAQAAGFYQLLVELPPGVETPVAAFLYDQESVVHDSNFLTFGATSSISGNVEIDEEFAAPGRYFLKLKNLPDPFSVDDAVVVPYAVSLQAP